MIVRQAYFLPFAELYSMRPLGYLLFNWCWISFIKHEDGKGSLMLFYYFNLRSQTAVLAITS